ncbi:MAG: thioredoxin domain-containing protein [bacterium]|nr:thioredoxin domain-containing protein [bacterium]
MTLLRDLDLAGLSPYLIQHRDNPVDWYPWGEEAFAVARRTERPILLSVGYSTCHWCHVMERESFHDEATAGFMNRNFVSVKVDREERPDVDSIYMDAVHAMTGRGGWPMTVFLTPAGEPFFAGTYFPDVDRHGMPSFRRVLEAICHAWAHRRADVQKQATELTRRIGQLLPPADRLPGRGRVVAAYRALAQHFDPEYGGLGGAPKFPQAPTLEFLTRIAGLDWAPEAPTMLATTLRRMALGGIRDHLGGGFARYAVDRVWLVPHFEKMLYDNADLARLYLRAAQVTGETLFRQVAVETIEYMLRDLAHPGGGFFAAEDADSEGVEGKFYVFGHDEFHEVVGRDDGPPAAAYFGVTAEGNFEGLNVLHEAAPAAAVAERFGLAGHEMEATLARAKTRLLARRDTRIRPGLDHKIITAWNGLALRTLAVAGAVLGERRYLDAARANARFVLDVMRRSDGLLARTWSNGLSTVAGFLDDHAAYTLGLLELYQATGEAEWFQAAADIVDLLERHFGGPGGVVLASASGASDLVVRPPDQQDNPSASGASLAAECYLMMGHLTGDFDYHDRFEQILRSGDRLLEAAPSAMGHLLAVLATSQLGYREVAVSGPDALRWAGTLANGYRPNVLVAPATGLEETVPVLRGRYREGETLAYVCERGVCQAPVASVEEMLALL